MKQHKPLAIVIALYTGILLIVFGTALWPKPGMMIYGDDIHRAYYFFREFFNHWFSQGVFPWWNPYQFGGEPFVANPIVNIWYPPTWLFVVLPLNIAYSWHMAIHVLWAMVGMYVLCKQLTGNKVTINKRLTDPFNLPAFVSGVVYGLSGFFMARTFAGHVDVIAAASWTPWVVWAFTKNNIAIASIFFALQLFAGYQTIAFFSVMIIGVMALSQALMQRSLQPLVRAGVAGVVGIGLAAIQILPEQEFFRQSIRTYHFPYRWISYGSITWQSLWQLIHPFYFGNQFTYHGPPPNFVEHSMFVGVGGLVLGLIGLMGPIRSISLIVLFGLWVSLGPNAPIDLQKILWQIVPMYKYLRIPPRHLFLAVFGLSVLAGIGMSKIKNRWIQWGMCIIVLVEMVMFGRGFIQLKAVPEARHDKELITLLKQDQQPYRVLQNFGVWLPARDVFDFDSAMAYGVYSATGYDPSISRPYYEYMAQASGTTGEKAVQQHDVQVPYLGAQSAAALDFLNIKYILVPPDYDPFAANSRYKLVNEDHNDYRLYENTTVNPRFYFADSKGGSVDITSFSPNSIKLTVQNPRDQQLLSSEVNYPGWRAYIDGKRADITVSNIAFRTLFVPEGNHTIVYRYVPIIFVWGGLLSFATALGLYIMCRKTYA